MGVGSVDSDMSLSGDVRSIWARFAVNLYYYLLSVVMIQLV